ncbi:PAS domain S-box protein [Sphingomonas koreensis]|jgi:PAS domain S-box-containing protein|nr:PAS domain S-box protein [Sphingomonas koreensis]MDC7808893.1 PAS domain S-box protein [Sphingomonas koreensis]RSU19009.1 PAS domain S-box protein [Sphingomonas koreensis]RSU24084.1 PAS domain S-box protein [Sphingomonas koreensis]RSU26335.1 PAS domain S-box protein [Sphingomonas koreensis]RSU33924.1 PAS domain S-box protein [Sphingomonas koreensis]
MVEGNADIFPGKGEMARIMREHRWEDTPLGDASGWPDALKIPLRMLLTTRFEMWLGWGPDLRFFYNDAYIPTLGIKHPAMLGRPFREVWAEVYDEVADQVERVRAGEATWNKALRLLLERSGFPEETYHSFSYSPLHQADGSVGGLLCVVNEETARIIGERRLETMRQLGLALAGTIDHDAVRAAVHGAFAANRRDFPFIALRIADGASAEDDELLFEPAAPSLPAQLSEAGQIVDLSPDMAWPAGDWDRPPREAIAIAIPGIAGGADAGALLLGLNPYRGDDTEVLDVARLIAGQIGGALASIAALQAERRRGDRMWSISRDLMVAVDASGVFRLVSPSWTRILGHPVEAVIGHPFTEFMHPDDVAASNKALANAFGARELTNYENRLLATDGSYHRIEWHTTLEDGLVYAYGRDVTERRLVEDKLSDSEEQFRHLVQGVTDYAIYMVDLDGRVSSWNEGARRIKGYEPGDIIGKHFSRFYTEEDREAGEPSRALETARSEGRFIAEGWRVRKNGERFRASVVIDAIRDDEGRPIGFAKITRDITEREQTQRELEVAREALFQSQKMDAIGQLTGGVAHDFNNLLMAVLSSLELLRRRLPEDPLSQRLLNNAVEGAQRGATLTQRMLAFARRQDLKVDRVDLSQLLTGMNDLVQRSIGPEWPISTSFPLKLPAVRADANQLEMALLNLIVNARDAMPAGGPILISASCEMTKQGMAASLPAGSYVKLVVKDKGMGMDAETLRRATEPFFTTKGVGKGTGLGLPMVHGMAQQIGGTFELLSEIGEGTRAVLWLPVAEEAPAAVADSAPAKEGPRHTARLSILAVDDDALVLINTAALLEDLGHEVIEADSGAEALKAFQDRDDIDLVVTDQAMPNMTGVDLIAAIDGIRPGTPVIIASGYGEGVETPGRDTVRLSKPFNQVHLAEAIARAMEMERERGQHGAT